MFVCIETGQFPKSFPNNLATIPSYLSRSRSLSALSLSLGAGLLHLFLSFPCDPKNGSLMFVLGARLWLAWRMLSVSSKHVVGLFGEYRQPAWIMSWAGLGHVVRLFGEYRQLVWKMLSACLEHDAILFGAVSFALTSYLFGLSVCLFQSAGRCL